MLLPDLDEYRAMLIAKGATYPLQAVPYLQMGLLGTLPAAPKGRLGWPWTDEVNANRYDKIITWPKLTIVTPSYNQAAFLEQTIRSVLLQNYPSLEYIIIDGGSTDGSRAIIEKYAPWVSYWQCEKDKGQSNAINLGFSLASGNYYGWINSDDYYLKNVFHLVSSTFIKTHTDFIYGYAYTYNVIQNRFDMVTVPPLTDYFIKIPTLLQPSCFWKAAINQPIWEELHCALDYELWLRLIKGKKRERIREPLSVANVHDEAKTSSAAMKQQWHEDHVKMWSADGHGPVPEWKRIVFLNRVRMKFLKLFKLL